MVWAKIISFIMVGFLMYAMATRDEIDRRRFISAFGIGTAAAFAGCLGTEPDEGSDELVVTSSGYPDTIHPLEHLDTEGYFVSQWTYSSLTRMDHELNVQPDLATDWEPENDGENWTFELREGVTFNHNDSEVVADDVKATFETIYDPDSEYPGKGDMGDIDDIEVVDDHTVVFNLSSPDGALPGKLAGEFGRIMPKETLENDIDAMHNDTYGSGPFELEEIEEGSHITVTAVDDFYFEDEEGNPLPHADRVTLQIYPETSTEVNALETGSSHIMDTVPSNQFDRLDDNSDIDAIEVEGGWIFPVVMRTVEEPFDDNRVRDAFKFAYDKEEMLEIVVDGLGAPGQDNLLGPAHQHWTDIGDPYGPGAQPERAEELLEEAGYGDGLELDDPLYATAQRTPETGETAVLLQEQMSRVGVEFEIEEVSWDRFLSEVAGTAPFYMNSYGMRPVEETMFGLLAHSDGAWNREHIPPEYEDEFDQTLENAIATPDSEEREAYLEECSRIMQQQGGLLVPFYASRLTAASTEIENYEPDPGGLGLHIQEVNHN